MIFVLVANCTFEAKDMDEALKKVSDHFLGLMEGGDPKLILGGTLDLKPEKK